MLRNLPRIALMGGTRLDHKDLSYVTNIIKDGLDDERLTEEMPNRQERSVMLYNATKFFGRMANIQIRPQEYFLEMHTGRMIAMLESLPGAAMARARRHRRMPLQRSYDKITIALGAEISELVTTQRLILTVYCQAAGHIWKTIDRNPYRGKVGNFDTTAARQARVLFDVLQNIEQIYGALEFQRKPLQDCLKQGGSADAVDQFLGISARTVQDVRSEACKPGYRFGSGAWRLSPLERFPILDLSSGAKERFIIPNIRTYSCYFFEMIDCFLREEVGSDYTEFMGYMYEVYVKLMLEEQLESLECIPELTYSKHGNSGLRGPDLTIIDPGNDDIIMVEIKGRRPQVRTRIVMAEEFFDENYSNVYDALLKLPGKLEDMRNGLGGYEQYREFIEKGREKEPLCICVLAESVYHTTELIRARAEAEESHPLKGFPFPFCVMSLDRFEMAVAIAKSEGRFLGDILRQFWEDSANLEFATGTAERFGDRELFSLDTFGKIYFRSHFNRSEDPMYHGQP